MVFSSSFVLGLFRKINVAHAKASALEGCETCPFFPDGIAARQFFG